MLKHYFKIAWRKISRHKIYTVINVTGLALGICTCIVVFLITDHEFSYDRNHQEGDRIYRVISDIRLRGGKEMHLNSPYYNLPAGYENELPGFEAKAAFRSYGAAARIPDGNNPLKKFDGRMAGTSSPATIITSPSYFDIFRYDWLAGNPASLNEPFKVVLSQKRARQYFGDVPIGQMMGRKVIYGDSLQVTVSGIVADWPGLTDLGYTDFISLRTAAHSALRSVIASERWTDVCSDSAMAFVRLSKGTPVESVNQRIAAYIKQKADYGTMVASVHMWLQPLSDIHFTRDFHRPNDGDAFRKAYRPTLYVLTGVAIFILLLAAVNFINLSTAVAIHRAKEVGVRKVLGGRRRHIIFQFLAETFIVTLFAAGVSVALVIPVFHAFRDFIPEGLVFYPFQMRTLLFLLVTVTATTLLAGFYPARVLASCLPALTLKGVGPGGSRERIGLRKSMIVFQFTISLLFIVAAMTIGKQINFMKRADMGFSPHAIITIDAGFGKYGQLAVLAQRIRQLKGVDQVLLQGNAPMTHDRVLIMHMSYNGKEKMEVEPILEASEKGYIPFYRMKLIAGSNLPDDDSLKEVVVNETLTRIIGFRRPQDAVGQLLHSDGGHKTHRIVGVVADFHQRFLHDAIAPVVIGHAPAFVRGVAIRLTASDRNAMDVKAVLSGLEREWKQLFPEEAFQCSFLNESIAFLYGQEEKTAWLTNVAMGITIFISCMGLFGLGMFTAERRTKEIGIRKVLGASVADIALMLNRDFVILVLIAFIIAAPVSWYFMHRWLQDFAYRTSMSWWIFAVAGLSALAIALLTVGFQALKAAVANPVDSLRTE
ncbi:ABC transporter permease [Flavitalea sp. BT771]|uniref:ABC transporter permease n=1 Tax=Flavitalea sp. BT771 TaxID=3063329 RepID=UPI0026E3EA09|nr:FtsX-like permease family protein [Flavitalea sp. BT771]MDO6434426.1 ABC transporter permease [Flavitalea sp. BT771]MDV6223326.1 FtsX-like permease family protein [Flavitalea sp. BT771]